jgi:hypothetical protein
MGQAQNGIAWNSFKSVEVVFHSLSTLASFDSLSLSLSMHQISMHKSKAFRVRQNLYPWGELSSSLDRRLLIKTKIESN